MGQLSWHPRVSLSGLCFPKLHRADEAQVRLTAPRQCPDSRPPTASAPIQATLPNARPAPLPACNAAGSPRTSPPDSGQTRSLH